MARHYGSKAWRAARRIRRGYRRSAKHYKTSSYLTRPRFLTTWKHPAHPIRGMAIKTPYYQKRYPMKFRHNTFSHKYRRNMRGVMKSRNRPPQNHVIPLGPKNGHTHARSYDSAEVTSIRGVYQVTVTTGLDTAGCTDYLAYPPTLSVGNPYAAVMPPFQSAQLDDKEVVKQEIFDTYTLHKLEGYSVWTRNFRITGYEYIFKTPQGQNAEIVNGEPVIAVNGKAYIKGNEFRSINWQVPNKEMVEDCQTRKITEGKMMGFPLFMYGFKQFKDLQPLANTYTEIKLVTEYQNQSTQGYGGVFNQIQQKFTANNFGGGVGPVSLTQAIAGRWNGQPIRLANSGLSGYKFYLDPVKVMKLEINQTGQIEQNIGNSKVDFATVIDINYEVCIQSKWKNWGISALNMPRATGERDKTDIKHVHIFAGHDGHVMKRTYHDGRVLYSVHERDGTELVTATEEEPMEAMENFKRTLGMSIKSSERVREGRLCASTITGDEVDGEPSVENRFSAGTFFTGDAGNLRSTDTVLLEPLKISRSPDSIHQAMMEDLYDAGWDSDMEREFKCQQEELDVEADTYNNKSGVEIGFYCLL